MEVCFPKAYVEVSLNRMMNGRETDVPWRGIVVHIAVQSRKSEIKIDTESWMRDSKFRPREAENDFSMLDVPFKGICSNYEQLRFSLKPSLKNNLFINLASMIEVPNFVKRSSVSTMEDIKTRFGCSNEKSYCAATVNVIVNYLIQKGCNEEYRDSGPRKHCVVRLKNLTNKEQFVEQLPMNSPNIFLLSKTTKHYLSRGNRICGIAISPEITTESFNVLFDSPAQRDFPGDFFLFYM